VEIKCQPPDAGVRADQMNRQASHTQNLEHQMLHSTSLVAFVATAQTEAAKHFYESVLGLSLLEDSPFALVFDSGGTMLRVQKVEQVVPAPYTVLGWQVSDIEASVRSLRAKGAVFQRYEGMSQDALGIWKSPGRAKVAWFRDPDGNTLSLTELAP
jgi:catechol 2,3-dioxygenase-like lactoylglutathione lyase family enzyme